MKEIILTRNTMIGGKPMTAGDKVRLPENEAKYLVNIGKAKWPAGAQEKEIATSKAAKQRETR